jgi:microsomal prostaglandin-E synthase 1
MTPLISQPVFVLYAECCATLIVTMYALAFLTAKKRAERKAVVNFEDVRVNGGAAVVEVEHPDVQRIKRAHLNAIENAVPFFVIGFIYTQTSPSLTAARVLFLSFVGIRVLHAMFYLTAKQPFRTASFALGALINLAMVVQVLRAVL